MDFVENNMNNEFVMNQSESMNVEDDVSFELYDLVMEAVEMNTDCWNVDEEHDPTTFILMMASLDTTASSDENKYRSMSRRSSIIHRTNYHHRKLSSSTITPSTNHLDLEDTDEKRWDKVRQWWNSNFSPEVRWQALQKGRQPNNSNNNDPSTSNRSSSMHHHRSTVMHVLCSDSQPPMDILHDIAQILPTALSIPDETDGWLPLHCACAAPNTSVAVLELLATTDPNTLLTVDHQGRTPLHILIIYRNFYHHQHQQQIKRNHSNNNNSNITTATMISESMIVTLTGRNGDAANICDYTNGMLPLHYACSMFDCPNMLDIVRGILLVADLDCLTTLDNIGRTPFHIICQNCHQPSSAAIVSLMLSYKPTLVNVKSQNNNNSNQPQTYHHVSYDYATGGRHTYKSINLLPLHNLNIRASTLTLSPEEKEYVKNCLCVILAKGQVNHKQKGVTMEFYTALQELPDWLNDTAVTTPSVQTMLNHSISRRLPSAVLLLDLYCQIAVIVSFTLAVIEKQSSNNNNTTSNNDNNNNLMLNNNAKEDQEQIGSILLIAPLYFGGIYFLLREAAQIATMRAAGNSSNWFKDIANWFDVTYIAFVFVTAFFWLDENVPSKDNNAFVAWCVGGTFFIYLYLLSFLRSVFIEFAIFVNGFIHVMKRLVAFIVAMFLIIVCFMQVFFTLYQQSDQCPTNTVELTDSSTLTDDSVLLLDEILTNATVTDDNVEIEMTETCNQYIATTSPFCNYWTSFLHVYTMLLGEVELGEFVGGTLLTIFFIIFMYLVVILLANVLIALVVDSYGVIKNERAEIVFWANRLDFIAEMYTLRLAQCNNNNQKNNYDTLAIGNNNSELEELNDLQQRPTEDDMEQSNTIHAPEEDVLEELWKALIDIFDDDGGSMYTDMLDMCISCDFWMSTVMKIVTALIIIPLWLLFGVLSAGWFWPPQVRKWLFTQKSSKSPHTMSIHVSQYYDDVDVVMDDNDATNENQQQQLFGSGEDQRRLHAHFQNIRKNTEEFHSEMNMAFCTKRNHIRHVRKQMKGIRNDMRKEMKEIKQVMTMMFEQHTSSI